VLTAQKAATLYSAQLHRRVVVTVLAALLAACLAALVGRVAVVRATSQTVLAALGMKVVTAPQKERMVEPQTIQPALLMLAAAVEQVRLEIYLRRLRPAMEGTVLRLLSAAHP
jgi:hypothetical protein